MKATVEQTGEKKEYDVVQAYRVDGTLVEFLPDDELPSYRYRIVMDGSLTNHWIPKSAGRPSKKLAIFYYEKITNGRYVITS